MHRKTFLTIAAVVAILVGSFALSAAGILIDSVKGAAHSEAANVMARVVGVLLISVGVTAFLVRAHEDSRTLEALLAGNLILQVGLFPIELIAYANGVFTKLSGIMPNTVVHVFLAGGFAYYLVQMKLRKPLSR